MVEAFSLRCLSNQWGPPHNLARGKQTPPFAGDNAYGDAILEYRHGIVEHDG
jgi:hypothetical protein